MFQIDLRSAIPIHEQIKAGIRELILKGHLKPGDPLLSANELAETLLVNPQAVARAYQELTKEEVLQHKDGYTISETAGAHTSRSVAELVQDFVEAAQSSRSAGLSWNDLSAILELLSSDQATSKSMIPSIFKRLYFESREDRGKAICPYCRESLISSEDAVSCMLCRTSHHKECWAETSHCSVFGCKGRVML
jgi:GntR family transcriptional regulator